MLAEPLGSAEPRLKNTALGGGTGQTDGQDQHMIGPPSRNDGPIISNSLSDDRNVHVGR